jgi:hypothetical protein
VEKLYLKIKGLSDLLMNNPQNLGVGGPLPTPDKEAEISRYEDEDGNLVVPAIALRKSIMLGATGYKIGKFSLRSRLSASIQLFEEFFNLKDDKGNFIKEHIIDRRRVVIQRAAVIRSRAKVVLPWNFEGVFGFNAELLMDKHGEVQLELLKKAINIAGQVAGLLDFRPNKGGWFGKYELVDIEVQYE